MPPAESLPRMRSHELKDLKQQMAHLTALLRMAEDQVEISPIWRQLKPLRRREKELEYLRKTETTDPNPRSESRREFQYREANDREAGEADDAAGLSPGSESTKELEILDAEETNIEAADIKTANPSSSSESKKELKQLEAAETKKTTSPDPSTESPSTESPSTESPSTESPRGRVRFDSRDEVQFFH